MCFDGEKRSTFNGERHAISTILFILNDLEGDVWFGGGDGIWKYDGHTLKEITINGYGEDQCIMRLMGLAKGAQVFDDYKSNNVIRLSRIKATA